MNMVVSYARGKTLGTVREWNITTREENDVVQAGSGPLSKFVLSANASRSIYPFAAFMIPYSPSY